MNHSATAKITHPIEKKLNASLDLSMSNVSQQDARFKYPMYDGFFAFYQPSGRLYELYSPDYTLTVSKVLSNNLQHLWTFILPINDLLLYVTVNDDSTLTFKSLDPRTGSLSSIPELTSVRQDEICYLKVFTNSTVCTINAAVDTEDKTPCNLGITLVRKGNSFFEGQHSFSIDGVTGDQLCVYCSLDKMVFKGPSSHNGGYCIYDKNKEGKWVLEIEE